MPENSPPDFHDLGGAATMDPNPIVRWITSKVMTRFASYGSQLKRRAKAERKRMASGEAHRVDYFHQVDDPYSLLAVQMLPALREHYELDLKLRICGQLRDRNFPEPDLLGPMGCYDAGLVASHYGVEFPAEARMPDIEAVLLAQRVLVGVDSKDFSALATKLGLALFSGNRRALNAEIATRSPVSVEQTRRTIDDNNALRTKLGHYQGATFHCAPEWYWGPDRVYHLENRLIEFGARRDGGTSPLYDRPVIETGPLKDDGSLTLEFYPSVRSPYSSIAFDKTMEFAKSVGIRVDLKPVLPMVMRGAAVTRLKGTYIPSDTAREAVTLGVDWGPMYDPIGQPVRNVYSLYPWAVEQGKGVELISSFMRRAWFEGVNTNNDRGMQRVVEGAELDWSVAKKHMGDTEWEALMEENRQSMYGFGSWGVPSYRLRGDDGKVVFGTWGQDRLWYLSREVQRILAQRGGSTKPATGLPAGI